MLNLTPVIERIWELLHQNTDQSVTYAALEARLALEKATYDRLRQRHAYISYADLRRWTPGSVINTLLEEVDENIIHTAKLMIGNHPDCDPKDQEYVEIGFEIGFDPKQVAKLWNSLSSVALHVRLPKDKDDRIPDYGNRANIRAKVEDAIKELERIAKGTMTFSGFGEEVSFVCSCGRVIKRKSGLLQEGKSVSCTNRECRHSFTVGIDGYGDFKFSFEGAKVPCEECEEIAFVPKRELQKISFMHPTRLTCNKCGYVNMILGKLYRSARKAETDYETEVS